MKPFVITSILAPTDLSDSSIPALRYARLFADRFSAKLTVMGTHLRHGWRRALLGSVSEGVLHASECPVLTVATRDGYVGATPYAITNIMCPSWQLRR